MIKLFLWLIMSVPSLVLAAIPFSVGFASMATLFHVPHGVEAKQADVLRYSALMVPIYFAVLYAAQRKALFKLPVWFGLGSATYGVYLMSGVSTPMLAGALVLCALYLGMLAFYAEPARVATRSNVAVGDAKRVSKQTDNGVQYAAERPRISFKDLDGYADLKARMLEAGQEIVESKSNRNGILLFGGAGNGKTSLAEALAGELRLPLINANIGDLTSQWVGVKTERAMKIFDDAEAQAPCLLFVDEIESVLVQRDKIANAGSEDGKTVGALLTRLISIRGKGVVVVGATNYIDRIDEAAKREGRFDFKIEVPQPDYVARKGIITRMLGKANLHVRDEVADLVALKWAGFPVSRLIAVTDEVASMAKKQGVTEVDFNMLASALRVVQGHGGKRLPEDAPRLEDLILSNEMVYKLNGLAKRMTQSEKLAKLGGSAPTGVMFHGPSGTGKSTVALALAKTTGYAFLATTGADLLENPAKFDELLDQASDLRPCLFFIDEGDDAVADRRMNPHSKPLTNKLLAALNGVDARVPDVMFVIATNHPDMLDEAALRGGRFGEKVEFTLPDQEMVVRFVQKWGKTVKVPKSKAFSVKAVVDELVGQPQANIRHILDGIVNAFIERTDGIGELELVDLYAAKAQILG